MAAWAVGAWCVAVGIVAVGQRPVAREVDVSRDPAVQTEVSIAIDPGNARILLAGSNSGGRLTRVYSSLDGGKSWTAAPDPPLPAGSRGARALGDPAVAIDLLGRQYYALLVGVSCDHAHLRSSARAPRVFVAHRASGTAAWTRPAAPVASVCPGDGLREETDDKPGLAIDLSRASPRADRVYVVWTRLGGSGGERILLARSDDGARSWSPPVQVNAEPLAGGALASVAVGPRGDVYVAWDDLAARTISIARSSDGSERFGPARLVAREWWPLTPCPTIPARPARCVTADASVTVAGASGRFAGRVYVTYGDGHAVFVAAFDRRLELERTERVDPPGDGAPADRFLPAAAVDATDGTFLVCFYDTRGDPSRVRARYSCTSSYDGGRSWTRLVRASSVASNEGAPGANRAQYGDYEGLAVAGRVAHPIWTDTRDLRRLREEIYTTTLAG